MSFMLSVVTSPIMLIVVMLGVVLLNFMAPYLVPVVAGFELGPFL
jgi:hypothetical protein